MTGILLLERCYWLLISRGTFLLLLGPYCSQFMLPYVVGWFSVTCQQAIANELGLNFISVKGPELLSMVSPCLCLTKFSHALFFSVFFALLPVRLYTGSLVEWYL